MSETETANKSAQELVGRMKQASDALDSYTFDFEIKVKKPGAGLEQGKLFFKKPRLMRVEEMGAYKKGSVAVLQADGKVRAKAGGLFGAVVLTLEPDSDMLRSSNEWPLVQADFVSIVQSFEKFLADGKRFDCKTEPQKVEEVSEPVLVLEIFEPSAQEPFKRVFVDPNTSLPVALIDLADGKVTSESRWKKVQPNASVEDKVFKL